MENKTRCVFVFVLSVFTGLATGCASSPAPEVESPGQLMTASYDTGSLVDESELCEAEIVDQRTPLDGNCINVIDRSPTAGRQIHAVGREMMETRDLCDNLVLPKCRRRY